MEIVLPARDSGDEKRSETRSRLSERAADGFDGRTRPTRALEDLAILRFDEVARRGIPAQAAQRGAGNFAVRGDCPILIEHVEQHEFRPRCWFLAAHLVSSFCKPTCHTGAQTGTPPKLTLLRHPLKCLALALNAVEKLSALDRKKPNELVLPAPVGHARSG
jgi:hypothetical protein